MQLLTVAALGAVLLGLLVYRFVQALRELNDPKHPPGPLQIPFLGRIHDLPIQHMWLKFKAWSDQYGPQGFYRTTMLGANFIVVTDEKVAEDLLMRRAKINSDRPAIRSLLDSKSTAGSMAYLPLMGRNQHWARQRRFGHAFLTEAANAQYHGLLYHEAKRWVARLMAEPDDFQSSLEDMTSKVMCQLAWDDPSLSADLTRSAWGLLTQMSPAGPITNVLTPLWHLPLPLNPWKRAEMRRHAEQQAWWAARLDAARAKTARGALRACWTWTYLDREAAAAAGGPAKTTGLVGGDGEAASAIGMLALVGIFTVVGPLSYWLVAMVHHPRWQAAVQREVDEVCEGRMPVLGDTPRLPVLRACIKETMRWRPNVPTGVAHETEADDEYNGFFIPKGSRILPLDW